MKILAVILLALAAGCAKKTDPVQETLDAVVKAANARDADALLARVSPDFEAADGTGRNDVEARLKGYFQAYEILHVQVSNVQIERSEAAARVRLRAEMNGQPRSIAGFGGLLPSAAKYDFDIRLVRDGKDWKLAWAGWQPVQG
jgi:type IV pilus biogenesis protein CpaD/CtpE